MDVRLQTEGEEHMQDVIFVAITVAFFVLSVAYVQFCDRIR